MLICSLVAIWGAGQGLGPFVTSSPGANALAIQLFLLIAWVPVMALAALIRERTAAETKARASEEQLAIALDAAQLGRWEFDVATDCLTWSDATRSLYEVPMDAPVSRATFEALIHPDDRAIVAAVETDVARGRSFDVEFRVLFPDGRIKWIQSKGKPILDDEGHPQRVIGVKADVTRRKLAELHLHEQHQKLALSSRASVAGELWVALAHELNQPLAAILVNASAARRFLLQDPPDLQELSEIVDAIAHDNRRAAEVITRLRVLLGSGQPRRSPVNMNEMVATVLDIARGDLLSRGVSVSRHLAPSLPPVQGDPTQLQQVLLNLIANSCEAMESVNDGRRLRVATGTEASGDVTVTISDSGPGVAEDRTSEIFEPFVTSHHERLGLGLAICRSIVTSHDGRLWVDRAPDGGAAFSLALPGAATVADDDEVPAIHQASAASL